MGSLQIVVVRNCNINYRIRRMTYRIYNVSSPNVLSIPCHCIISIVLYWPNFYGLPHPDIHCLLQAVRERWEENQRKIVGELGYGLTGNWRI